MSDVDYEDRMLTTFENNETRRLEREVQRLTEALELSRAEVRRLRDGRQVGRPSREKVERQQSEKDELRRRAESAEKTAEFSLGRCKVLSRDLRAEKKETERLRAAVRSLGGEP